jgi:hypothetical protein
VHTDTAKEETWDMNVKINKPYNTALSQWSTHMRIFE